MAFTCVYIPIKHKQGLMMIFSDVIRGVDISKITRVFCPSASLSCSPLYCTLFFYPSWSSSFDIYSYFFFILDAFLLSSPFLLFCSACISSVIRPSLPFRFLLLFPSFALVLPPLSTFIPLLSIPFQSLSHSLLLSCFYSLLLFSSALWWCILVTDTITKYC